MGDIFHNLYQGMLRLLGITPMLLILVGVISGIMGGAIPAAVGSSGCKYIKIGGVSL